MSEENNKQNESDFRSQFKELFNLKIDKANNQDIIDDIKKDTVFKGPNLWILMFAIIICSIGLDINSTAVIIGGMLISPLMGPLMGIGMGISRNDLDLIKTAVFNIGIALVLSVVTSAIYFYISPLNKPQSELLSRTSPAVWDVLIAFAGGFAGIIAYTRKEKNNVIPGVAIATALMPPLSTAGFGLATGNFDFFWGALYLFSINSIFIAIGTYIVIRILKIRRKKYLDPAIENRAKRIVLFLIMLIIIPSILTAIKMVKKNTFERNVEYYIAEQFDFNNTIIISKKTNFESTPKQITITLYGEPLDSNLLELAKTNLTKYKLGEAELIVKQGNLKDNNIDNNAVEALKKDVKSDIVNELYIRSNTIIKQKNEEINTLKEKITKLNNNYFPIQKIAEEAIINYPKIEKLSIINNPTYNAKTGIIDTLPTSIIKFKTKQSKAQKKRLEKWLKIRMNLDTLIIIEI